MTEDDLESAKRYRQRAERLRAIAQDTKDKSARKLLLQVADDYDRLADARERVDKADRDPDS